MSRSKFLMVIALLLVIVIGFFYYQYRFYRTPVAVSESSIDEQIIAGGPPLDGIPAINEPKFESVFAADQYLDDNSSGVVLEHLGRQRFYPFQILVWHMIVNDVFDGKPLLMSYDPLSESANVFERTVEGSEATFTVSGKLYNSNMLMSDAASGSLWSQLTGKAITGEKRSQRLTMVPSLITTWKNFKEMYPNGQVLSRSTGAVRDYTQNPYDTYQSSYATWFPVVHRDDRLEAKTIVFGFDAGSEQKAYLKDVVREKGEIQDEVDGKQIVVYWDPKLETVRGRTSIDEKEIIMQPSYWFSWVAFYPQTELVMGSGLES